jgi:FMN phosphatase YigB (HAD superfamily)/rhamnose utilization protein RhaD (predicted bifunctional aldolase and dehydrogenase)
MFYKGIIFDLDNTLYNYDECHNLALQTVIEYIYITYEIKRDINIHIEYNLISTKLKNELVNTASSHNKNIYFKMLIEKLNLSLSILNILNRLYWGIFYNQMRCFDGVQEFIIWNKNRGIKIGILTDYETEYQIKKLNKLQILEHVDVLVTSEEVGIEKPSVQMFQTILRKLNLNTDEVIMIGDNYNKDILGATELNIFSYWFNKTNENLYNYNVFNCFKKLHNDFQCIYNELINFEKISKFCGERFDLVQAGGGNTSFKINNWLFIKSSGISMCNINTNSGYVIINNTKLLEDINASNVKDVIDYNIIGKKRGSIETFMHCILKKYTIHLHPIQVNRILISNNAVNIVKELFPQSLIIDYVTPGIKLCDEINLNYNNENLIFLLNHGLIITCDNYEEVFILLDNVMNKFERKQSLNYEKYKFTNIISNYINNKYDINNVNYLCENATILSYFKTNRELFHKGVPFPDSLIYCGITNLFITNLDEINDYAIKYNELPKIIIMNDYIYINSNTIAKCKEIEDVLLSKLIILDSLFEKCYLNNDEILYLNNWDSEKYRKTI